MATHGGQPEPGSAGGSDAPTRLVLASGTAAGLVAGLVMMLIVMLVFGWTGLGFFTPAGAFGSLFFPETVDAASFAGALFGLVVQSGLSMLIGIGLTPVLLRRLGEFTSVLAALVAGMITWVVLLFVLAPLLMPRFARVVAMNPNAWFAAVMIFGVVLGLARSFLDAFAREFAARSRVGASRATSRATVPRGTPGWGSAAPSGAGLAHARSKRGAHRLLRPVFRAAAAVAAAVTAIEVGLEIRRRST